MSEGFQNFTQKSGRFLVDYLYDYLVLIKFITLAYKYLVLNIESLLLKEENIGGKPKHSNT